MDLTVYEMWQSINWGRNETTIFVESILVYTQPLFQYNYFLFQVNSLLEFEIKM